MSGTTSADPGTGSGTYDYSAVGQPNMNDVTVITPVSGTTTVQASNQTFVVNDADTAGTTDSTINVIGGNNRFVVSLKGTTEGNNAINVDGGNNQFVVEVAPSGTGDASSQGGNTVNIDGGNSQFVVVYNYSSLTGTPSGNNVSVGGGNNAFVVSYQYGTSGSGSTSSSGSGAPLLNAGSGNNQSVITPPDAPVTVGDGTSAPNGSGDNVYVQGGDNQFVVASQNNGTGPNVGINGNNNAFVVSASSGSSSPYDFSGLPSGNSSSAPTNSTDSLPTGSAPSGPGSTTSGNPFASLIGGTGSGPASAGADAGMASDSSSSTGSSSMSGSITSSMDINSLLAASPFGPLLNLPGVTAQTIFGNAGLPAQGSVPDSSMGGSLAGVIGAAGMMTGGSTPGTGTGTGTGSSSTDGSTTGGSYTYDFSAFMNAMGDAASSDSSGGSLEALLRQSPFGALLDLPGVTPETLFGNLGSSSDSSASNPFGSGATPGANPFTNYPGTTSIFSASDPSVSGAIPTT